MTAFEVTTIDRCPLSKKPAYLVYDWREESINQTTGEVIRAAHWGGKAVMHSRKDAEMVAAGGVDSKGNGPDKLILIIPNSDINNYGYALTDEDVAALNIFNRTFATIDTGYPFGGRA